MNNSFPVLHACRDFGEYEPVGAYGERVARCSPLIAPQPASRLQELPDCHACQVLRLCKERQRAGLGFARLECEQPITPHTMRTVRQPNLGETLLAILRRADVPLSAAEIETYLDGDFSHKSVRMTLFRLCKEGQVAVAGKRKATGFGENLWVAREAA